MNGTAPNRLRLRLAKASTTAGRSSTQAGPMLLPMVPKVKSNPEEIRMNRRAATET
jgi:hypothetical protein